MHHGPELPQPEPAEAPSHPFLHEQDGPPGIDGNEDGHSQQDGGEHNQRAGAHHDVESALQRHRRVRTVSLTAAITRATSASSSREERGSETRRGYSSLARGQAVSEMPSLSR